MTVCNHCDILFMTIKCLDRIVYNTTIHLGLSVPTCILVNLPIQVAVNHMITVVYDVLELMHIINLLLEESTLPFSLALEEWSKGGFGRVEELSQLE